MKKGLIFILCVIIALMSIMTSFRMINQPNWLWNLTGLTVLFLVGYSIAKTKCFTQFKKN